MKYYQPTKRIFSKRVFLLFSVFAMHLLTSVAVNATTITVTSVAALQTAINNASAGDVLILANGTYLNNTLSISKSNVTVKAATSGGVFLNGTNDITISGNYVTFSGFQFTSGDIGTGTIVEVTGSYNVVTQLNFSNYFAARYIHINDGSQYNQITFCNLEKKPALAAIGCTIQISTSPTVPGYHKIRYCSFQNYYGVGGDNGNEPIRIGLGSERDNVSRTIVEYCYFNNTGLGDSESVSVKSGENTIRFCTFTNQQNAMLCFRNGANNVAYSNFFINAGGIRVKEANNIYCYNNYFYNSGDGTNANAVTLLYVSNSIYANVLNNVNFIHNTFVDCSSIDMGGTGATSNTWANNIFKKTSGSIFTNANSGTTWTGNIRSGTLGISNTSGMANAVDPLLITNTDAYLGLSSTSPAIDAASASYPAILDIANIDDDPTLAYDISGQARPSLVTSKDVGADEYTTGTTSNRPLAVTDVGPNYLGGPSITVSTQPNAASVCSGSTTSFSASSTSTLSPTTVQWQRSANSGTTWTNITANLDAVTTYSGFTTETLVLTGSSSTINNYQYKAVFTNTIGSVDSNVVTLTVITTALPTGAATKTICGAATVASLTGYTGTALQWYSTLTGGSALGTTAELTSGNYYVSQTLNGCESARKTVVVTVTSSAPVASSLLLCNGSTVADLTATGTALKWYATATGGSQLASSTTLSTTSYYVSQTVSTCESSRTAVSVVIYTPASLPTLNADGPGNTYELITSVLAPCQGVTAVEAPDMLGGTVDGTHPAFGRHIAEVMDNDLGKYVFEFYSHVTQDNDITGGLDRERVEMKTYGGSTDNLKGVLGETVTYKWRFKVPTGFQPSSNFTHIHQVKAVDGDDSSPLFTLTPRYGTPNTLQIIYVQDSNTSADTRAEVNLSLFENTWVEAIETIKIGTGTTGTYAITIKKVSDGTTILSYSSNAIQTIRTAATDPATTGKVANSFIRPKWGIYRSLANSSQLRDDSMRFSDISISEIISPTAVLTANTDGTLSVSGVAAVGTTVTVKFPDGTTVTGDAGLGGVYGSITSGVLLSSGNVVVTYVINGNTSPETIGQFTALPVVSNQSFCTSATVASLAATGTLIKWYAAASGGSALATATILATGTYYVTQTVNGLESVRTAVMVNINTTAVPTASPQSFCGSVTVASLTATGTALKWYLAATGGSELATAAALSTGTYYVSQTLNSCESLRTSVAVTVNSTGVPTANAQAICNSGTVANLTATGTALKWYTTLTGGSALASSTALVAATYYVTQTLNSCESARVSSVVTLPTCILSKQVIAEQPYHDGGFEGQSGVLGTTVQTATNNIWRSSTSAGVATVVGVFNTSTPRSGNTYLTQTLNATTPANNQSGYSRSAFGANPTTNVAKWVTFYYKPTPGVTQTSNNLQIKGGYVYTDNTATATQAYGATVLVPSSTSYTKYSKAVAAPTSLGTSNTQLALYLKSVAGGVVSVDVDDIVIYDGTAEDVTAPNAPATASVANVTATGLDVNWTSPTTGGLDGGGYVVVRYASNPNADNDPNVNGIYAVGNTITNGTGSLVGTVVYIGTGTSFTDTSLVSSTSYYYKVYAVDKAFNYSLETMATGTTSGPLALPVATAATAITATGFTANWGAVSNASSYDLYIYNANTQSNIAAWTFPSSWAAATGIAPIADIANANNTSATITQSSGTVTAGDGSGGVGTYAISGASWYSNPNKYWEIQVNTLGYRNVKVSSKLFSTAPKDFKLQYKIGSAGTYADVDNGAFVCASNWTTGVLSNLALPVACDNATSVYLRWVNYTNIDYNTGVAMVGGTARLDDIYITGGALASELGYPISISGTSSAVSGLSIGTYYYDVIATGSGYISSAKSNLINVLVSIPQSVADYKSVGDANTSSATNWQYYNGISWITATTAPSSANNITISSGNTVSLGTNFTVNSGKAITVNGTINLAGYLVSGSGSFSLSSGASIKLGDNTSLASAITTTNKTFDVAANYFYDGTIAQTTASLPTGTMTGNVTISNAAGVTMAAGLKINTPGTLEVTATGKLLFGDGNVVSSTIGSGTFTYTGTGNFTVATGATLIITSSKGICTGTSNGNIKNSGTRTFNSGVNYIFAKNDGANAITMGTSFGSPEISATLGINNLTINNPLGVYLPGAISTNAGEYTPDVDITVNGVLNFVSGKLIANNGINSVPQTTGTKTITIANSGTITGASSGTGWVIGNLKKATASAASPSFTYTIGDATNYLPLALTFSGATSATGGLTAKINTGDTSIAGSGIDSTKSVNRTWTLTNSNLAGFTSYNAIFTYAIQDIDSNALPQSFAALLYNGASWTNLTTSGTPTSTNFSASSITGFGDFAIGQVCTNPTFGGTISGTQSFCLLSNSVAFASNALPSGHTGNLEYKWQSSTNNITFTDIAGATASTYTAPPGITATTYYKRLARVDCQSDWTDAAESNVISVTVITIAAPTASAQTFCNAATIENLVATGTNLKWYTTATGGSPLSTTTALATSTYYVSQTLNSCESVRTAVTINVNITLVPTASAQTFCSAATVSNLVATGTNINWYDVPNNGTALTGSTAIDSGTYYVSQTLNSCEGARRSVAVTVNANPTFGGTIVGTQSLCSPANPAAFSSSASASGQTGTLEYQWQSSTNNINFIDIDGAIATIYNAPSGLTETTFYKRLARVSCKSDWIDAAESNVISVTVNPVLTPTFNQVNPICFGETLSALPTNANNNISGSWSPAINSAITTTYTFTPSDQCSLLTTMNIVVKHSLAGTITPNQTITWNAQPADISLMNSSGAVQWQSSTNGDSFSNINGATGTTLLGSTIGTLTTKKYFRAIVNDGGCGNVTSELHSVTIITTTNIRPSQCGSTLSAMNSQILATIYPSAQMYRFEVSNGATVNTYDTTKYNFDLTKVPGTTYATTYGIRVAVKINGVWGNFGTSCNVTTPTLSSNTVLTTKLHSNFCGATLAAVDTKIAAATIFNATGYRFEITTGGVTTVYDSSLYLFRLEDAGVAAYGTTYAIRVAVLVNGTYGNYGASCNVTTPTLTISVVPTTKVLPAFCGTTLAALDTKIGATPISMATAYRFEITTGGITTIYDSAVYNFRLAQAGVAAYGTTYSIRVAAQINGVYGNYGASCNVTTPVLSSYTVPTTQIHPNFCGITLAALDTKIPAAPIYNASGYRFEITTGGVTTVYDSAVYNFKLSQTGVVVAYGTTYAIRVAALVNGVYGNYGVLCNVTTPADPNINTTRLKTKSFEVSAYPNPFENVFNISLETPSKEDVTVAVYDMMGRQIENKVINANEIENTFLGQNYSTGVYNVIVSQGMNIKMVRLIKN